LLGSGDKLFSLSESARTEIGFGKAAFTFKFQHGYGSAKRHRYKKWQLGRRVFDCPMGEYRLVFEGAYISNNTEMRIMQVEVLLFAVARFGIKPHMQRRLPHFIWLVHSLPSKVQEQDVEHLHKTVVYDVFVISISWISWRGRAWMQELEKLVSKVVGFAPPPDSRTSKINLLIMGGVGSGKSSLVSSLDGIFEGRISR
jgi:hypothetical protein